jgi:hypothetical protein
MVNKSPIQAPGLLQNRSAYWNKSRMAVEQIDDMELTVTTKVPVDRVMQELSGPDEDPQGRLRPRQMGSTLFNTETVDHIDLSTSVRHVYRR